VESVTSKAEVRDQIAFIQTLRGISVLLVLWVHLGGALSVKTGVSWLPYVLIETYLARPLQLWHGGAHLGVVLFFLISGFIITHVSFREGRRQFAVRRVYRLLPPFLIAFGLVGVALAGFDPHPLIAAPTSAIDLALNLTNTTWFVGSNDMLGPTWSLVPEVLFYIIVLAAIPYARRNPQTSTGCMLLLTAAIVGSAIRVYPAGHVFLTIVLYLPVFIVGRCIYFARRGVGNLGIWIGFICAAWLVFTCFNLIVQRDLFLGGAGPAAAFTYVYAMAIFCLMLKFNTLATPRVLSFVADISYGLYLYHMPVGSIVAVVGQRTGAPFTLTFIVAIGASIFVSWLSFVGLERSSWRLSRSPKPGRLSAVA
jgi:exopolysaccharide production protein ExoZ